MPDQILRFAIWDGSNHCAATWRLWTPAGKSDIYLASRSLGGVLKTSLHESGRWHVAYSQETFEKDVQGAISTQSDRFLEKWSRPEPIAEGVTMAFRIVTPHSSVTSPVPELEKKIAWISNCPSGRAIEIYVLITAPTVTISGWPGKTSMGTQLIGTYALENSESVWVVYCVIDMPDFSKINKSIGQFYKGRTRADLESENLRAVVFGEAPDGSRVIYDCAVIGPNQL